MTSAPDWLRPKRIMLALAVVVLLCVVVFAYQAWRAGTSLVHARSQGRTLTAQLNAGDLAGARRTAAKLRSSTSHARSHTSGPLWDVGGHLPFVGRDVHAVQVSADVLHAISAHSLPTLLSLAQQVESGRLRPHHGRVDLHEVAALAPSVRRAAAGVDGPAARMNDVHADSLTYPLDSLVTELSQRVGQARAAIDATRDAFDVLPTMLGADGPRTYLLIVQNNAEIRSTGGLPGSWAVLHARNGKLSMGRQGDASLFATGGQPVKPTKQEAALYGRDLGRDPRDLNFNPDFSRVAQMATGLARAHGVKVDGVFAVDPVSLALVLRGTGPVDLGHGARLTAANATPTLLNTIYRTIPDPSTQNDFYARAARKVFDALVGGQGDQVRAIRGLVLAAGEDRVLAWSDIPAVAKVIGDNSLSGALPRDTGTTPQVGLYLNDGGAGKMEYYLRYSSKVSATECLAGGVQQLRVTTTFRSTAPPKVASYPVWVTGTGKYVKRGDILMNLRLYAPYGGSIESLRVDGRPVTVTGNVHDGRQVGIVPVQLPPGGALTVSGTLLTGKHQTGDVRLTSTPGMELTQDPVEFPTACD